MKHYTAREMVRDLIDSGLTQQQIAERIRVSQATIARVFKGSDTRYEAGKRLAGLHREVCAHRYPSPVNVIESAVEQLGGVSATASVCKVTRQAVRKWINRGRLPRTEYTGETCHAQRMAEASQGAFSAEWLLEQVGPSASDSSPPDTPKVTPRQATATTP